MYHNSVTARLSIIILINIQEFPSLAPTTKILKESGQSLTTYTRACTHAHTHGEQSLPVIVKVKEENNASDNHKEPSYSSGTYRYLLLLRDKLNESVFSYHSKASKYIPYTSYK